MQSYSTRVGALVRAGRGDVGVVLLDHALVRRDSGSRRSLERESGRRPEDDVDIDATGQIHRRTAPSAFLTRAWKTGLAEAVDATAHDTRYAIAAASASVRLMALLPRFWTCSPG